MFKKFVAALAVAGVATVGVAIAPADAARPTIVTRAVAINESTKSAADPDGEFATLIGLVTDLGLADALSSKGQLTVFAPTDAAFANLFTQLGPDASKLDDEELTQIVLYHVTSGRRGAGWLTDRVGTNITMLTGQPAAVTSSNAGLGLAVDGANVVIADVAASNGFIHAVDTVLLPPNVGEFLAD